MSYHTPIMCKEVVNFLDPQVDDIILDGTLGGGGHSLAILNACPGVGKMIGIDRDPEAVNHARNLFQTDQLIAIRGNFSDFSQLLREHQIAGINKVILDLGISSHQIDVPARGFSYVMDGPLDMRMDASISFEMTAELTAAKILRDYPPKELARVFRDYGEEPACDALAREIVRHRQSRSLQTTLELSELIHRFIRGGYSRKMTAVKRIFQALRIEVNGELAILRKALQALVEVLPKQGRMVVLTFHSLEDRIVKQVFHESALSEPSADEHPIVKLTRKAVKPSREEIRMNKRSASAKLRAILRQ